MRAICLFLSIALLGPGMALARCQSIGDVMRAETAATDVVRAEGAAALNRATARLNLRLDVLTTLYPRAEEVRESTLGAYISTRRALPLIRQAGGREAAEAYARDARFTGPLTVLSSPGGPADCGAPAGAGGAAGSTRSEDPGEQPLSVSAPLGQPGDAIARVGVNFDKLPMPDFRLILGLALLAAMIWLGSMNGRRRRRYLCSHPIEIVSGGRAEGALALDISRAGAKLRGERVMIPGQEIEVRIGGAARRAEVQWARDDTFGVRFTRNLGVVEFFRFLAEAKRGRGAGEAETPPGREPRGVKARAEPGKARDAAARRPRAGRIFGEA